MSNDVYTAFGNKVRTKLIFCLAKKSKNVTELIESCHLSQSAVSQHLSKLKKSGIVTAKKSGQTIHYSLTHSKAIKISTLLLALEAEIAQS